MKDKRIIMKVGSNILIDRNGFIQKPFLDKIIAQIDHLKKAGYKVLVVSSGAIALGRSVIRNMPNFYNTDMKDKIAFSIGQHMLMTAYQEKFQNYGYCCSQVLINKGDFDTRQRYLNMMYLFEGLFMQDDIVTIVNENDSLASDGDMFVDNDELAGLIAAQVRAHKLILMTNVDGLYDKDPADPTAQLIKEISPDSIAPEIEQTKSTFGRGGMFSKLQTSLKAAKLGIETTIMNAHDCDRLADIENIGVGTKILPVKAVSSLKRWLSFSKGVAGIYVNECLSKILLAKEKSISILPIGITGIQGEFNENDAIYIFDNEQEIIGIGLAEYNSQKLQDVLGQPKEKEIIHCDNLFVY